MKISNIHVTTKTGAWTFRHQNNKTKGAQLQNVNNMIKITLKFIIYMSNLVDCHYFQLNLRKLTFWPDDLYRPWMTLYDGKSYISEIYMKNQVEWHLAQFKLKNLNFDLMTLKMTSDHGKSYISENYRKNQVEWHPAQLNLKNLIFDLSWPLPTLDDFVCWKIIYIWKLYEKSSWLIPYPTQSDKVDFWPFLTFNQHFWPLEILIR